MTNLYRIRRKYCKRCFEEDGVEKQMDANGCRLLHEAHPMDDVTRYDCERCGAVGYWYQIIADGTWDFENRGAVMDKEEDKPDSSTSD